MRPRRAEAQQLIEDLGQALAGEPGTGPALDRLRRLVAEKLEEMDRVVAFQRAGQAAEARD
jgi:CHASE3 domain sensor protein